MPTNSWHAGMAPRERLKSRLRGRRSRFDKRPRKTMKSTRGTAEGERERERGNSPKPPRIFWTVGALSLLHRRSLCPFLVSSFSPSFLRREDGQRSRPRRRATLNLAKYIYSAIVMRPCHRAENVSPSLFLQVKKE